MGGAQEEHPRPRQQGQHTEHRSGGARALQGEHSARPRSPLPLGDAGAVVLAHVHQRVRVAHGRDQHEVSANRRAPPQAPHRPVQVVLQAEQEGPVHRHVQVHRSLVQSERGARDTRAAGAHAAPRESDQPFGGGGHRPAQGRRQEAAQRVAARPPRPLRNAAQHTQPAVGHGRRQAHPVHDRGDVRRAQGRVQGLSGVPQGARPGARRRAVHALHEHRRARARRAGRPQHIQVRRRLRGEREQVQDTQAGDTRRGLVLRRRRRRRRRGRLNWRRRVQR